MEPSGRAFSISDITPLRKSHSSTSTRFPIEANSRAVCTTTVEQPQPALAGRKLHRFS